MKDVIIAKLNEIAKLPPQEAKAYDTSITWAFVRAVT